MDAARIASLRRRIVKANASFSAFGDLALHLEIDAMSPAERIALRDGLRAGRRPVYYGYLTVRISKDGAQ